MHRRGWEQLREEGRPPAAGAQEGQREFSSGSYRPSGTSSIHFQEMLLCRCRDTDSLDPAESRAACSSGWGHWGGLGATMGGTWDRTWGGAGGLSPGPAGPVVWQESPGTDAWSWAGRKWVQNQVQRQGLHAPSSPQVGGGTHDSGGGPTRHCIMGVARAPAEGKSDPGVRSDMTHRGRQHPQGVWTRLSALESAVRGDCTYSLVAAELGKLRHDAAWSPAVY